MTVIHFISLIATGATTLLLGYSFYRDRAIFLKPSFIVLVFFVALIQWSSLFFISSAAERLANPWHYFYITQLFPFVGSLITVSTFKKSTRKLYESAARADLNIKITDNQFFIFFIVLILITVYYLYHIGITNTGLYALFFKSRISAVEARESSLKLLDNRTLTYLYSFGTNIFAPIVAVLNMLMALSAFRNRRFGQLFLQGLIFTFIIFMLSLTGAKSPSAKVILTMLFAYYVSVNFRVNLKIALYAFVIMLIILMVMQVNASASHIPLLNNFAHLFYRIFADSAETGLNYVHYAQTNGTVGIAGISKIANLMGIEPVDISNLIHRQYYLADFSAPNLDINSGSATAAFVFSNYVRWGFFSLIFSLISLFALDFVVLFYNKIKVPAAILIAFLATQFLSSLMFVQSDFTTVLITHGFLIAPMIALFYYFCSNYLIGELK